MKTKRILNLAAIISCFAASAFFLSNNVFARGHNGGSGGTYDGCGSEANAQHKACFNEYGRGRGGVSWRYYTTDQAVTFRGYQGTGGDTKVEGCESIGGFWYHGFESFHVDNGTVKFDGFQVGSITKAKAESSSAHYLTSGEIGGGLYSRVSADGYGGAAGGKLGTISEVQAAYETAAKNMVEQEGASTTEWPQSFSNFGKSYFCYAPEAAAYAAKSSASIVGGSSTSTSWSSVDNAGAPARKTVEQGEEAEITFKHYLRQDGSGALSGTSFSVSTQGGSGKGSTSFSSKSETEVYSETIRTSTDGSYCSVITYNNKALSGAKTVTSKICAEVGVNPTPPPEAKEATVTFSAQSKVEANGNINAINEETNESYTIPAGELLNSSDSTILSHLTNNDINIPVITVIDEWIPLKFSHAVTRTDDANVTKAYTHTILTPPSTAITLNNVGEALKKAVFKSTGILDTIKQLLSGETTLGELFSRDRNDIGAKGTLIQRALENAVDAIDSRYSDYALQALRLRTTDLGKGETDDGYSTTGEYKSESGNGQDYCQTLLYQSSRRVYDDDNEVQTLTGLPWLDRMIALVTNGGNLFLEGVQALVSGGETSISEATLQAFWSSLTDMGKFAMESFTDFLNQVISGNMPTSRACVRLKRAFDFNIEDIEPQVTDPEKALVGETLELSNNSEITIVPLHNTLTDTSDLTVTVVSFLASASEAGNLKGNFTTDYTQREHISVENYFGSRGGYDFAEETKNVGPISRDPSNKVVKTLRDLGFSNVSRPVPDVDVNTLLCFAIGVKDSDSDSKNAGAGYWAVSGATCRPIAKKPSLSITGGSVYSGDEIITSITRKNADHVYGSRVEYGAIAKNEILQKSPNISFASGNQFLNYSGTAPNGIGHNQLTIANHTSYGNSGVIANTNLLDRIINTLQTGAGSTAMASFARDCRDASGEPTICYYNSLSTIGGADYDDIIGTQIIYNPGDITIEGDIKYSNVSSASDIPQVIIISGGIIKIESDVERVDAWLVATNGSINTCLTSGNNRPGDSDFDAEICKEKLTINGPVITKNSSGVNKNYRTGGSGVDTNAVDPAEIFNLPASTYVWAYNTAQKITDTYYPAYVKELAPRY